MKLFIHLLSIFLLTLPHLEAKEKIHWLIWELTPEFIRYGNEAGNGYGDKFLKRFIKNLPEYEHEIIWVNTKRWFKESSKYGRCTPHIWKRFKLDEQYYSKAYTFTAPHGILVHNRNRHRFGQKGEVLSLEEILKDDSLTLTVPIFKYKREASRYPILYPFFEPYIGKKNLKEVTSTSNEVSPEMLEKKRADYLIAYSTTAEAYSRIEKKENSYTFFPLKEDPFYKTIHVACDKSSLGNEVILKINSMLNKELFYEFLQYHEEWNDKNIHFRQNYINYFIQGNKDSFIIH